MAISKRAVALLQLEKKKYEKDLVGIKEEARKHKERITQAEATIADYDEAIQKLDPKKK